MTLPRFRLHPGAQVLALAIAAAVASTVDAEASAAPAPGGAPAAVSSTKAIPATPARAAAVAPAGHFLNPLNPQADPWIGYAEGRYHLATTQGSCVRLWSAASLADLPRAQPVLIWEKGRAVWAPEFNRIKGPNGWRWYCYFTKTDGADERHRMFVAESAGDSIAGPYGKERQLLTDPEDKFYAIDGHVYQAPDGRLYLFWAGHPGHRLFIARMKDPFTIDSPRAMIPASGFGCAEVREGPFVLRHGGRVFLTYSACDTGKPDYAVGYLWMQENENPMDPKAWRQHREPLLRREDAHQVYGPGHHSFFTSPDGTEVWIAYHAKTVTHYTYKNRTTRAQKLEWDENGFPKRIVPAALSTPLPLPSGDPGRR